MLPLKVHNQVIVQNASRVNDTSDGCATCLELSARPGIVSLLFKMLRGLTIDHHRRHRHHRPSPSPQSSAVHTLAMFIEQDGELSRKIPSLGTTDMRNKNTARMYQNRTGPDFTKIFPTGTDLSDQTGFSSRTGPDRTGFYKDFSDRNGSFGPDRFFVPNRTGLEWTGFDFGPDPERISSSRRRNLLIFV